MITLKAIYGMAAVLMIVSVFANLYNFVGNWGIMNWASRISFLFGSILFQILIMTSFIVMYKMSPSMPIMNNPVSANDKELYDYIKGLSDEKEVK